MADRRVLTTRRHDDRPPPNRTMPGVTVGDVPVPRTLPVCGALAPLLPAASLRGGAVVACEGRAAVTLAAAVVSAASVAGSWTAVLGLPEMGLAALAEAGVVLERVVCVAAGGDGAVGDGAGGATGTGGAGTGALPWPEVLAAAVDGFEMVVVGPALAQVPPAVVRRVLARAAARGVVLVAIDVPVFGADLHLDVTDAEWRGLDAGHGVARERRATVRLSGRRVPRHRHAALWLPSATGGGEQVAPGAPVARLSGDAAVDTMGMTGGEPVDRGTDGGVVEMVDDAPVWRSAG
ncbi:MAG: hypothetical protein ACO3C1_12615 [Ilumatobacteraceae bacterium]